MGHIAATNQLGGSFQEPLRGVRAVGQKRHGRREGDGAMFTLKLADAHLQLDRIAADRQIDDAFAGSGLMHVVAGLVAMRTDADSMFGRHRETVPCGLRLLFAMKHDEARQMQQTGPKLQRLSCHDAPSRPE